MNKKMLKLFGEAFLKTLIVILGIAIVIFAIYFLIQIFGGGGKDKDPSEDVPINTQDLNDDDPSTDDVPDTIEPTTEPPATAEPISSVGHTIEVLNSTDTAGVAAGWQEKLNAAGFNVTQIGNYETETLTGTRIIVTQEGMGQDLVGQFRNATVEVGTISSGVEIQIIIGTDDAQ
ncbi:MAG: LytR C-terminal domain-containing protein [Bacteroides sp.]|nr:LytR C-terminal domain-containing protein [Bacteroides sp.]MCM1550110.1 LytR C-terminal domain-containing protein [Clostridium sp.]